MAYDDIIIGSGLSALATAMGLPEGRRILVLTEGNAVRPRFYDDGKVPCAATGLGGLGNYWHGVIPFGAKARYAAGRAAEFEQLFSRFYPQTAIVGRLGSDWLFVPKTPVRPSQWWPNLVAERAGKLELAPLTAKSFDLANGSATVHADATAFTGSRIWICAGALDTPALLARSLPGDFGFLGTASDHVIAYLGQIDRRQHPSAAPIEVERLSSGYWFKTLPDGTDDALLTAKPARFSYRTLDRGIEQRAAFGLPVGGAIAKIARSGSLGLLSEAIFNKFGLLPASAMQSVYGQIEIPAAHQYDLQGGQLTTRRDYIQEMLDARRQALVVPGLTRSRRPDLYIRGVHLHNTLDPIRLAQSGIGGPQSPVRIQDASTIDRIGGEHHSFHMMVAAYAAARQA